MKNAIVLSKAEMKNVMGGGVPAEQFTCYCDSGTGGFSPRPGITAIDFVNLTTEYCGTSSATCNQIPTSN